MGWASRRNPVALDAKSGVIAPKPRAVRPLSAKEDAFLALWTAMWDRVHGIQVDIQPRIDPETRTVAA